MNDDTLAAQLSKALYTSSRFAGIVKANRR
jgi:hypothetical protein